jgi:hypothetical protein
MKRFKYMSGGLFLCLALWLAMAGSSAGAYKYAGEFLALGVGARPMGMGGAYTAISDDASAVYWNPSGLTASDRRQVLLMHAESFGGLVVHDYIGLAWPLGTAGSALGLGLLRLAVEDIPYTEWDTQSGRPRIVEQVTDAEYALFFSYARRAGERWSLGGSAKLIRKTVGEDAALGLGLDVGLQYRPATALTLGAKLADLTSTPVAWDSGQKDYIAPALTLGAAYRLKLAPLRGEMRWAVEVDTRFEDRDEAAWAALGAASFDPRSGLEYWYRERVALRAGILPDRFSAGASIRLGFWGVDYAFVGHDELDSSHRLSAIVDF